MNIKLRKWEIERLLIALKKPPKSRWVRCPFWDKVKQVSTKRLCHSFCDKQFPKCEKKVVCPHACTHPLYTSLQITRTIKKCLREQGVKI